MSKTHRKKTLPEWFDAALNGKNHEIRINDCDYQVGDAFVSCEWDSSGFTGREIKYIITHVCEFPDGLRDGYVTLSLMKLWAKQCGEKTIGAGK